MCASREPRETQSRHRATGESSPTSARSGVIAVPEILIVEDEPEIADLIEFHLGRAGFDSSIVHSGREGLHAIQRQRPDLVILDLMLPDLDGLEVCRRLKAEPATRSLPVVMVTAKADDHDIVTGDAYVGHGTAPWISEMYGYVFASAEAGIHHILTHGVVVYPDGSHR